MSHQRSFVHNFVHHKEQDPEKSFSSKKPLLL